MTVVTRESYIDTDIESSRKILFEVLGSLGATISTVHGYIEASIGSYTALSPSKAKRDIRVFFDKVDGRTLVRISVDYGKYLYYSIIGILISLALGVWLYDSASNSINYLEMLAS